MTKLQFETSNVTAMRFYKKPTKNPIMVELLNHWERLRGARIAPRRSEIDPRQIENVLEHAFILERPPSAEPRFRIAGMQLHDLMGMEVRGMPANSIIVPDARPEFDAVLVSLFAHPEIVELDLAACRTGFATLAAEMLLLPMQSETGEISRILGCVVAKGQIATPPNRFSVVGKKTTRIVATSKVDQQSHEPKLAGFAEPQQHFIEMPIDKKPHSASQSYLKLVSNRDA